MPTSGLKQFIVNWTEDNVHKTCACKGFAELFRKLEAIQWVLLNGVDVSELTISEA